MPALFAVTLFVSATLLFVVQPMVAKMVLPKLGGTPAVWNTCMVFFQAALLAGYAYAHATTAWLGVRKQAILHLIVLALPLLVLPIAVSEAWVPPPGTNPVPAVLGLLAVSVGLPFLVVSTSAPLLQKWFAGTGHPSAKDPYFLYSASNVGSMLALVAYPAVIERHLRLVNQSRLWEVGYIATAALAGLCGFVLLRTPVDAKSRIAVAADEGPDGSPAAAPIARRRLHWVLLAFAPSSLMLGVTTYLSTDIASIPLIWVVPLALYLLSFILVFSRLPSLVHTMMVLALPVLVLLQLFLTYTGMSQKMWVTITLHLVTLFTASMCCHGELARRRPPTRYLTEFYLWMSFGGVLGGVFNALVAPLVFKTVFEYQLVMVLACLLLPRLEAPEGGVVARLFDRLLGQLVGPDAAGDWRRRGVTPVVLDVFLPALLGLFSVGLLFWIDSDRGVGFLRWLRGTVEEIADGLRLAGHVPDASNFQNGVQFGVPILLCYLFVARPVRFGLGLAALLAGFALYTAKTEADTVVYRDRSFFGAVKLERTHGAPPNYNRLVHGTTLHGMQEIDEDNKPVHNCPPLTYYHREGPIGRVFAAFKKAKDTRPLAFVGLGTGTLASYGEPRQEVTFFEIDRHVERIARNPEFFTYVADAEQRGVDLRIVFGDARLSLRDQDNGRFRLIIVDAFSSDSIPVHLITREALAMYLDKLTPDGIIAFHISNRYLDLRPVLGNLVDDAGLAAIIEHDDEDKSVGKFATTWVLVARNEKAFGSLMDDLKQGGDDDEDRHWTRLGEDLKGEEELRQGTGLWTDDYSNLLSIFKWR